MFTDEQFDTWAREMALSARAIEVVQQVRHGDPVRRPGPSAKSVSTDFASRKMGRVISTESRTVELPAVLVKEHDADTLEYWEQPLILHLRYRRPDGSAVNTQTPIDLLDIHRTEGAVLENWKDERWLIKHAPKKPGRYVLVDGIWRSPPEEEAAAELGLKHRVRTSSEFHPMVVRNLFFLSTHLASRPAAPDHPARVALERRLHAQPGSDLAELLGDPAFGGADVIWPLVGHGVFWVDLTAWFLARPYGVPVYLDEGQAAVWQTREPRSGGRPSTFEPGTDLEWDGVPWRVVNPGADTVVLRAQDSSFRQVPRLELEQALAEGKLLVARQSTDDLHPEAARRYQAANRADRDKAEERYALIRPVLEGRAPKGSLDRTARRYVSEYNAAKRDYGWGYIGLLPKPRPGRRGARLEQASEELADRVITEVFEQPNAPTQIFTYGDYIGRAMSSGIRPMSLDTFTTRIRGRNKHELETARRGVKAAYPFEPWVTELSLMTPRHGDYPLQLILHDHTLLDWELVDSHARNHVLGRPWLSLSMDAFSRRVLAFWLTYDPPSYRSLMMLARFLVRRLRRLGEYHVVDGGKEFGSNYFESLLARHEAHRTQRPASKSRFGAVIERIFGITNTAFVHNAKGNTKATRQVRTMTPAVDPRNHAVWDLSLATQALAWWFFEVYDTTPHPALGGSPREVYEEGMAIAGERPMSLIPYDETFLIESLPTTRKGTAVNDARGRGVRLNTLFYFDDELRDPRWEGELPVRWDPFDFRHGYVFTNHWLEVTTHSLLASGPITQREWQTGASELRSRRRAGHQHTIVRATDVAAFLSSNEPDLVLARQRAADAEAAPLIAETQSGLLVPQRPALVLPSGSTGLAEDELDEPDEEIAEPALSSSRPSAVFGRYG